MASLTNKIPAHKRLEREEEKTVGGKLRIEMRGLRLMCRLI